MTDDECRRWLDAERRRHREFVAMLLHFGERAIEELRAAVHG